MIVADTCVLIWLASDPEALSRAAAEAIRSARASGGVGISAISLYELAWLASKGRIVVKTSLESFLAEVEARFVVLPVTAAVSRIAVDLPPSYPADQMDRMIGATAIDAGGPLVTRNNAIRDSGALQVIW